MSLWKRKKSKKMQVADIFKKYEKLMLYVAHDILKDINLAEDIVQESMIKIMKHINFFDEEDIDSTKVKYYILSIVRNRSIDELRKRSKLSTEPIYNDEFDLEDPGLNAEEILISKDTITFLSVEINKLDEKYSSVLQLKYFSDLSYTEIATILDITEENARKRTERAKKLLAKVLIERGEYSEYR